MSKVTFLKTVFKGILNEETERLLVDYVKAKEEERKGSNKKPEEEILEAFLAGNGTNDS